MTKNEELLSQDHKGSSSSQESSSSTISSQSRTKSSALVATTTTAAARPYRTLVPKALPDLDDVAMGHVFRYIHLSEQDLYWSFLSDSFFIIGGVMYVILSLWDVLEQQQRTLLYKIFDIIAPTVYLLNSIVDVEWAYQVKQRLGAKKAVTETWNDWRLLLDMDESNDDVVDDGYSACRTWHHRLRKHSAHRRTIIAAFTFGIAAIFGLVAVLLVDHNADLANLADSVSTFSYIASAVFACSGKRTRPWLQANALHLIDDPERLEDFGDLLFLVGSIVDGVLLMLQLDDANPSWGVVSSCLWCLDACFYFRSDFVMYGHLRGKYFEGSALV